MLSVQQKTQVYKTFPELASIDGYINTPGGKPITLAQYRGDKVVLVDFWTYSCINCTRSIPYLNAWYRKYRDQGLEIVGVHTPEFAFEHAYDNVKAAAGRLGIEYPIVLDNEYGTWKACGNNFWPRDYLIDIDGFVVYDHAGEGDYDGAERAIQKALEERATRLGTELTLASTTTALADTPVGTNRKDQSPETYFGASRNEFLGSGVRGKTGMQVFKEPIDVARNALYLIGTWNIAGEYAETAAEQDAIYYGA